MTPPDVRSPGGGRAIAEAQDREDRAIIALLRPLLKTRGFELSEARGAFFVSGGGRTVLCVGPDALAGFLARLGSKPR